MEIERRASTGSADFGQASDASGENRVAQGAIQVEVGVERRAYVPPQLRHLGSVRQLTLGPTGNNGDGPGQFQTGGGMMGMGMSSREVKEEIAYLDDVARKHLADEVMALRLANYRYREGVATPYPTDHRCLGIIVEDTAADAPFVVERKQVDIYGFASAILAALQEQQQTIARLERQLAELGEAKRAKGD
ncbi:hypothetical protein LZC95_12840 [Pendulispora brunnea]|uniref:Peptidase S74 domain-containing protein n=1 Tax=Pendulispora brunnea TaxID=2905690 RepID=A0ABZ2KJH1_9BACT